MARYTHQDQYTITGINNELEQIDTELRKMLSRNGDVPNALTADVDANGSRILNLPEPVNNSEPLTLGRGQAILDDATAAANRAESAATTAAEEAAATAADAVEAELSGYVTETANNAQAAEQSENQAEIASNQAIQAATSAQGSAQQADSSATQLSTFIDDYASSGLTFPLDLGFVGDTITNSFDLGELP